jgi:hypothetical protein
VVNDSPEHQDQVLACFPGHDPLLIAYLSLVNQGLTAPLIADQVPYLFTMKRLMKGWRGNVALEISLEEKPVQDYSGIQLTALEEALAKFYTQFFLVMQL